MPRNGLALWLSACLLLSQLLSSPPQAYAGGFLSVGFGYFDVIDDQRAVDFRLEYRPDRPVFHDNLKPWMGLEITGDSSAWVGGGILYDAKIDDNIYLTPSLGLGGYAKGRSDLDLGFPIEFRTQLEAAYQFETGDRAALAFAHISNGSIDNDNPGTEVLTLYWHIGY